MKLLLLSALALALLSLLLPAPTNAQSCPTTLQLQAGANRKRLAPGGTLKLTIQLRNTGAAAASNAVVEATLPAGVLFKSTKSWGGSPSSAPAFTQPSPGLLRWTVAQLPVKKRVKLAATLYVDACAGATPAAALGVSAYQLVNSVPSCTVTGAPPVTVAITEPKGSAAKHKKKATCAPTTAPTTSATTSPTAPCYNKEALVQLADGSHKPVHLLQKGERVRTSLDPSSPNAGVLAVVEIHNAGNATALFEGMCTLAPGFHISAAHPIRHHGKWIRPKWAFACDDALPFSSLFGLILDGDAHSVLIQGFEVATFVAQPVGVALIDIPHKLRWHAAIAAHPDFASGYVRIDARELAALRPPGWDGSVYDRLQFADDQGEAGQAAVVLPGGGVLAVDSSAAAAAM